MNDQEIQFVKRLDDDERNIASIRPMQFDADFECSDQTVIIVEGAQWEITSLYDRFTDATYAYQGGGRGLSQEKIAILENWVQGSLRPNCTLLFDVAANIGLDRVKKNRTLDRLEIEKEVFFKKARNCYLERACKEPNRFYIIDANKTSEEVAKQVQEVLKSYLEKTIHSSK